MTDVWPFTGAGCQPRAGHVVRVTVLVTDFRARHRLLLLTETFSQRGAALAGGTSRFCAAASALQSA